MTGNRVIGKDNKMPWHVSEELKHFKKTTLGFPLIMGRKTLEAMDALLKKRKNIVVTRNQNYIPPFNEALVFHNLQDAYNYCEDEGYEKLFVIGGGEIYLQALNSVDEIILSVMKFEREGDVFFPEIDKNKFELTSKEEHSEFTIMWFKKKSK